MTLKILQHNCLDLFIFLDTPINKPIEEYTEDEWQSLTYSQKGNKPLAKIKELAELYLKINPDILLLNEIGGKESLENFNKFFLKNKYQVAIKEGSKRGIDTGFLIKPKLRFNHHGYKKITCNDKEYFFSRTLNQVSILNEDNKVVLNIFGAHLKSLGGNGNSPEIIETRFNEVKGITYILKKQRKLTKAPYILAGDFNGNAKLNEFDFEFTEIYKKTSLRDIHDLSKNESVDRYSFVHMFRNNINFNQLDYIMLSKDLHSKLKTVKRFLFSKNKHVSTWAEKDKNPSDHFPQFAKIKL
jgi:endonuclease/exonuclease/phosphatase family metal-dependent hydrolase